MVSKKKGSRRKMTSIGIIGKMLSVTFFFTIIPLILTATLVIYTYQGLISNLLTEEGIQFSEEIKESLFLTLENSRIQAVLIVSIAIILTLFSNIIMSRNLTRPLRKLARGTHEITKGNLDFKIEAESRDEIGELSMHFNSMTQQLKETMMALEKAKTTLEIRVQARTSELKKTTEALEEARATLEVKVLARTIELEELTKNLEEQVKQRTQELREKVKELEKFQKFAVGREMKMVELKKEIKTLQNKTKKLTVK